jgi:flagellar basal body-associated protein FliL
MAQDQQLSNPFRKPPGGGRPAPPPGVTSKDWAKLYIMALVFLMAVGTAIYMRKVASATPKPKPAPQKPDFTVRPDKPGPQDPAPAPDPQEPPVKRDIPIPPLPKDGIPNFKELAAPFQDGLEKPVKETPEFIALLNVMMNGVTPESLSKLVTPDLNADTAYLDSAKHRGEVMRAYGRLIYIYTERIDSTTPNNVEYIYLGVLQEYPKNRTIYFYLPELPKDPKTGQPITFTTYKKRGQEYYNDWAEIEGVFLRRYDYPSQYQTDKGEEVYAKSAVLFVKNLRLVPKPEMKNVRAGFVVIIVIVCVLLVIVVLVAGFMTRKYGSGDLRGKMYAIRKEKAKADGQSPFPPPKPPVLGDEIPKTPEPSFAPAGASADKPAGTPAGAAPEAPKPPDSAAPPPPPPAV